jgi:nucleotide-binding universal stress UspA family protein
MHRPPAHVTLQSKLRGKEDEMKTILLATDGSPSAQKATDVAIELAGALDATLRILSVWRIPVYDYGYVPVQYAPELDEAQREGAAKVVAEAVAAAKAAGVRVTSEIRRGGASDEICAAAEETAADMIVLGAHGWGAMKRMLVGSVSTVVLHHAPCPVLVVRGDAEEKERALVGAGTTQSGI